MRILSPSLNAAFTIRWNSVKASSPTLPEIYGKWESMPKSLTMTVITLKAIKCRSTSSKYPLALKSNRLNRKRILSSRRPLAKTIKTVKNSIQSIMPDRWWSQTLKTAIGSGKEKICSNSFRPIAKDSVRTLKPWQMVWIRAIGSFTISSFALTTSLSYNAPIISPNFSHVPSALYYCPILN